MAKNRATAVGFLDRLAPATAAKERQEAADIRALAKSAGRDLRADRGRLELLRRADPQAALRPQQRRAEALFRVQQGADRRRLLRRQPALRADLQGAEGHPDLEPGHARVPGLRPGRQAAGAVHDRPVEAGQQERRRLDVEPGQPVVPARHQAGRLQRRELHQARARPARADQLGRRDDDVPRVRPRASRHVRGADLSDAVGHQRRPRLRRVPVAVQRELGARSQGPPALRGQLQTGQPIPQELVDKIKRRAHLQPGL